ncbi:FRA10AC1 [Cladochytrium replicatum]|nr:FRA10AC1 [Cladochytrium replicatum]
MSNAYERHKYFVNQYLLHYGKTAAGLPSATTFPTQDNRKYKSAEVEILKRHHRFLRSEDESETEASWEARVAKKYYDKLFKEYALANMDGYKQGKIAMRWRTEKEVISGKGQFVCANVRCEMKDQLRSWEVNFSYVEEGEKRTALVKLRLCKACSEKLNYKRRKSAKDVARKARQSERNTAETTEITNETNESSRKRKLDDVEEMDDRAAVPNKKSRDETLVEQSSSESSRIWSAPLHVQEDNQDDMDSFFSDLLL